VFRAGEKSLLRGSRRTTAWVEKWAESVLCTSLRLRTVVFVAMLALVVPACQSGPAPPPKIVLVFMDISGSVRDFTVYRDSWAKILNGLTDGDRIVLARINAETLTQFRPVLDRELPGFHPLTDNKLRHEKQRKQIQQELAQALDQALAAPRSSKTDILHTLTLAEKIFHDEKRRRILVLVSDMLEDSEEYNFERLQLTDDFTRRVIAEQKKKGRLPDLDGAKVYVAGASAKSANKALDVQQFWLAYCKEASADLAPQNYGPALMNFEK